jgi:hypothetical protein
MDGKRIRREYDRQFKVDAVDMDLRQGRAVAEVARDLGFRCQYAPRVGEGCPRQAVRRASGKGEQERCSCGSQTDGTGACDRSGRARNPKHEHWPYFHVARNEVRIDCGAMRPTLGGNALSGACGEAQPLLCVGATREECTAHERSGTGPADEFDLRAA